MKGKINLLARKVFATAIALAMSIPPQAFATDEGPVIYDANSSIMGINEEETENILVHNQDQNQDQTQRHYDFEDYELEISTNLEPTLTELTYKIKATRKESLEEDDANFTLNLTNLANSNISDLRLVEASTEVEETYQEAQKDKLNSLKLTSKAEDEIIYTVKANVNKAKNERIYNLILSLSEAEKMPEVVSYKLKTQEKTIIEDEEEKTILSLARDDNEERNPKAAYKEEGFLGGLFARKDTITWTDYILNEEENKEFTYDFRLDQNQETDNAKIALDYYEATEHGFEIKKEFSQEIDFAKKINFEIPQNFIAKITLTTQVDKKNTAIENYSLNNRITKNPIYIEGSEEKSSDDDEADGEEESNTEDTSEEKEANKEEGLAEAEEKLAGENKEETQEKDTEESSENKEENLAEKESQTEIVIDDANSENEENKNEISALILNKDSLVSKLETEDKLTDELKTAIEDLASDLDSYNDEKITDQDLRDFTKALAERNSIAKEDLRLYIESILSGLNKQTNKAANLNIDEIIDYAYPEEKDTDQTEDTVKSETDENLTNLEKADKELKEALADESNGLEEIQALLDSFEEKYKLTREDQEKLMTDNNDAIEALVEKDRDENFRPNVLLDTSQRESKTFDDKVFNLKTQMEVKASPAWPIPTGWYFDIKLGPYLKAVKEHPIKPLEGKDGKIVANGRYYENGKDHYIRYTFAGKVTETTTLNIDQILGFDTYEIGDQNPIKVQIKAAPKNNPVQENDPITVYKNSPSPVSSEFIVRDEGETQSGTYPYLLNWETTSQKLKKSNGDPIEKIIDLERDNLAGAYVEWDIVVNTSTLVDENNELNFNKLNLTVFGSANQGLKNISYRFANSEENLKTAPRNSTSNLGEIYSGNSSIAKGELSNKLHIKVRGDIDPNQLHESYSIGFRINPDNNYIDGLLNDILTKYKSIPTPLKWIQGVEEAERFAEVPFNLVETNIPATFNGLADRFNNERFYFDNTRTIVAKRIDDTKVDWYALDLLRRGETEDPALNDPTFYKNRINLKTKGVKTTKAYYVPLQEGGYRKTYQPSDAIINGQYYPGTIVSYEYKTQKAGRNDTYYLRTQLKDKKKFNIDEAYQTEGGWVELFTEKISDQALATGYLAYTENPYPIMRINRNFDLVACFNDGIAAPVYEGNKGVFLDIYEDPSGTYLISRLNESLATDPGYELRKYLKGTSYKTLGNEYISLNHNGDITESKAMEELMKKIYFYGEEVKKEYKEKNSKEMHRLIESSMYQRVIHHFTDGKDLSKDYFDIPSDYNVDEWKVDYTLTGKRTTDKNQVKFEDSFDGRDKNGKEVRKHPSGARKLKDDEMRIKNSPPVQRTQYNMAQALYNKVIASYSNEDWNDDKADSVKLVFYAHTDEGKYQELITGRVMAPIEIDKYKKVGDKLQKLEGAEFTFTNINTGESKKWESTTSDKAHKLYLRPGTYRVQETKTPEGYEKIKDFDIIVEREEINGADGPYRFKKLPKIHVNDGFETKVVLGDNIPKDTDGTTPLVELEKDSKIKVNVTNIEDNLGKLEFIKRNKFIKLDGAEFKLRKIEAKDLADAKTKFQTPKSLTYDKKYEKTSKGSYGEFKFEQIPAGFYVLEETVPPAGYEKAPLYLIQAEAIKDANDKITDVKVSFVQEYKEVTNENGEKVAEIVDTKLETEKANRDGKDVYLPIIRNKTKKTEIKFRKVRSEHVLDKDTEHLGLADARFRLMSLGLIDGDFYLKEAYTDRSKPTTNTDDKVDGQNARGGGYITFKDLKVGEYLLQEMQAPKGYKKTDLYGWKLIVSELQADDEKTGKKKGDLDYKLYKIDKEENIDKIYPKNEVPLDSIINGKDKIEAFQIGNESRKISIPFDKYLSDGKTSPDELKPANKILTTDGKEYTGTNAIEFNLYKADYYGAILKDKDGKPIKVNDHPIVQNKAKKEGNPRLYKESIYDYSFELHDLEFGGYYVLEEANPPIEGEKEYKKASRILLKVEAEAIANEGKMKVIVRDPNPNAMTNEHSVFGGVINFEKDAELGEFSIKKIGKAIDHEGMVGLRRAYFRLYTADEDFNILYKDKDKKYPKEYIQKVTPGEPITEDDGKGGQKGKDPDKLPPNQGIVTFDQLKPGNYVLEEYRGPAGYEKDPYPWYITVSQAGTVKKYRQKPTGTATDRQVIYSMQSPRLRMAGLDLSEPVQFNRLMATPRDQSLESQSYEIENEDAKVTVSAGDVDTSTGSREINISIKPKTSRVPILKGKRINLVFLVDRLKDASPQSYMDKNINYYMTQVIQKAQENGAEVDLTLIQYDSIPRNNSILFNKQNVRTINPVEETYKIIQENGKEGPDVTYKNYLQKAAKRVTSQTTDPSERFKIQFDKYNKSFLDGDYDGKYVFNFSSHWSPEDKHALNYQHIIDQFKAKGFDVNFMHLLGTADISNLKKVQKYVNSMEGKYGDDFSYYLGGKILPIPGEYTQLSKGVFEPLLEEKSLVTNGALNINLEDYIIVEDSSNLPSNGQITGINLDTAESEYKLSYKIHVDENSTEYHGKNVDIHKSVNFKANPNANEMNLDPDSKLVAYREEESPQPSSHEITTTISPQGSGILSLSQGPYTKGKIVTFAANANSGYKPGTISVRGKSSNEIIPVRNNSFTMPDEDVEITASFIKENEPNPPQLQGDIDLKTVFTYSNQKDGVDDSANPPSDGRAGTVQLYVLKEGEYMASDSWEKVGNARNAPYEGELTFPNLDSSKKYKLEYTREESNASLWGTETITTIDIDLSNPTKREGQNDLKILTISNGNLMEIFNKDETGFRIPLRITKVNENKGALTGAQFKARKIINGDKSLYKKTEDGKIVKVNEAKDYPVYHDEAFDGVSEATGEPGDNYFRELTPGIYELTEIKTPDGTYRKPVDDEGNPMKWYFKVFVYDGRSPRGADYMGIDFNFTHTFTEDDDFNKEKVTDEEKGRLIGTTIEGLGSDKSKFNKYIKVIPDDGRSNPARPDAPYQGIDDAQVTNYRSKTSLSFFKKDLETHKNLKDAEFSLRKVQTKKVKEDGKEIEKIKVDKTNKPLYEEVKTTDDKGVPYTEDQLKALMVQPYDKEKNYALATSTENLGVEFTNIGEGSYILEEEKPADGYEPTKSFLTITFTEDEKGSWKQVIKGYELVDGKYVEMSDSNAFFRKDSQGELVSIGNKKKYINFKFEKIRARKGANEEEIPVNTAGFRLTQVDDDGKPVPGAKQWNDQYNFLTNGFNFTKLGVGRYKLEEIKVIDEFEKPDPWYFRVKDDEKDPGKLKIEFEKPKGHPYNSIDFTPYENSDVRPDIDEDGNPVGLKVKNYSRIKFKFKKENQDNNPLKDAGFSLKKLRYSMDDKSKAYEYYEDSKEAYDNGALKKYSHDDQVTEFYRTGTRKKFTKAGKVYEFDEKGDLIKVNGDPANEADKKDIEDKVVIPDSVSAATGKYYANMRSQSDGGVTFDELGEGIYELTETRIPEGYQASNKQFSWIFEVKKTPEGLVVEHNPELEKAYYAEYGTEESKKYYKSEYSDKSNVKKYTGDDNKFSYVIKNTKTTTDLNWKKITNYENNKLITQRTQFWLFKVSDDPTNPKVAEKGQSSFAPYQVVSSDGNFEINDLGKGIYTLVETEAPQGYKEMDRRIVIQIYEDATENYKLKKNFYEMKREKDEENGGYKNVLVTDPNSFTNILTRGTTTKEVDIGTDEKTKKKVFYVNNEAKPQYFYLSKGFMKNKDGKDIFTEITKGELKIKIYADPKSDPKNIDTKVYERTIKLSDAKSYKIDVEGIKTGVDYILEEVGSPDGFTKTKNKYRIRFESVNNQLIPKLMAVIDPDGNILKGTKNVKQNRTEDGIEFSPTEGYQINGPKTGDGPLGIVNKKTEIEFEKVGKDGETETPLDGVVFYLEKQNPTDRKFYSLTEDMEMILPAINDLGQQYWYYIDKNGQTWTAKNSKLVTPENDRGVYKSNDKGKFKITDLTDGYYRLMEPEAPKDAKGEPYMKVSGPVKTFRVVDGEIRIADKDDETGKITEVEVTEDNKDRLGKIINEKPGKGEFKVKKYDDFGNLMSGVDFKLTDTSADRKEIASGTTDTDGYIHFKDLPYGYYWLEETKTKDGYILDTKKKLISLGGDKKWNVPAKNTDVSEKIKFAKSQEELESTSGDKYTVYPNEEEAVLARFKLEFTDPKEIKPGNYFTLKLTDDVDIDGIVKDNDGKGKVDATNLDIIGPAGVLAQAEVDEDRHTITYTFTDYVGDYTPKEMDLYLQLYPNRYKIVSENNLNVKANIGRSQYDKSINVDYRTEDGYQDPDIDVSSYMLRLDPEGKTFTAIVYYNQWNRMLTDKGIEFILDKNVDEDSLKVTTYKRMEDKKALAGSHSDYYHASDLPDSYGIDPAKDKLIKVGEKYAIETRSFYNLFGDYQTKNYDTITLPYGYLNKGYYVDQKIDNTVNTDPMNTTYVIEIKGKLSGENLSSLKTHVQYYHKVNWYTSGYDNYGYWRNNLLVGRYCAGAFKTWSQFYKPGTSASVDKEVQVINFRNRIDFVKVDGGVKGEVPDTTPDEEGKTHQSSIFANDTVGEALGGATFKLKKTGETDYLENSEVTSDDQGRFSWVGLGPGTYEVWETDAPEGYKLPKEKVSEFTVSDNGQITLTTGYKEVIANKKTSKIKIRKVDQDGKPIPGKDSEGTQLDTQAGFSLVGANGEKIEGWNNISKYTDKDGYATFEDIPAGNYDLEEIETPAGYTNSAKTWKLTVGKDGRMAWTNSFDDTKDILKQATYNEIGTAGTNLDTKIVGIDKDKKVFRQYNLIKANKDDLKANKIKITSPDTSIKLNQDNTRIRLVALDSKSTIDSLTPAKDDADYQVEYNGNSMDVSIKLPEEKNFGAVGSEPGVDQQKTYLVIVDMPYSSEVGAKASYKNEDVEKTVEEKSITEGTTDHDVSAFRNEEGNYYRPRLVNDLDFVIGNIKRPAIHFVKVDADKPETKLKGAEFELQKKNKNGEYKAIGQNGNAPGIGNPKWKATSVEGGKFSFESIPDGEYKVVETQAPDGYSLIKKDVYYFEVKNGKVFGKANEKDNYQELTDNKAETPIQIENRKAEYPNTGGPGTWIGFTLLGLAVMIAGAFIYNKRQTRMTE